MLLVATWCPIVHKAAASLAWLFDTHRRGRIGSPIVAGSTSRRRSSSSVGAASVKGRRPLPARRTAPAGNPDLSARGRSYLAQFPSRAPPPQCRRTPLSEPPPLQTSAVLAHQGMDATPRNVCEPHFRLSCIDDTHETDALESPARRSIPHQGIPIHLFFGVALGGRPSNHRSFG